jgi:hypothetical protein
VKEHRYIAALAIVLLGFCVAGIATAQTASTRVTPCDSATPNNAICLSWEMPATNTDGTPTVLAFTYRVERQTFTTPVTWTAVETVGVTRSYVKNLTAGNTYVFRVIAIAGGVESAPSNTASKAIAAPTPNAPVLIIAATINANGPPTYRIIQSVTLRSNEVAFVAPAAMRSLFVSR